MPTFTATAGNDTFVGTAFDDLFYLGGGSDTADGGAGNDTFFIFPTSGIGFLSAGQPYATGAGASTKSVNVTGGDGDDVFVVLTYPLNGSTFSSPITIDGGAGRNSLFLNPANYSVGSLSISNIATLALIGDTYLSVNVINGTGALAAWNGSDYRTIPGGSVTVHLLDSGVINLSASSVGNAVIYASSAGDSVTSGNFTTAFHDGVGNDVFVGGSANDTVFATGAGSDKFDGGGGVNTLDYSAAKGPIVLSLATGNQSGTGSAVFTNFVNVVGSSNYSNTISGDANANYFSASKNNFFDINNQYHNSNDYFDGGAGNDTISLTYNATGDTLLGGDGDDLITVQADNPYSLISPNTLLEGSALHIDGGAGNDVINVNNTNFYTNVALLSYSYVIDGGSGNDLITVTSFKAYGDNTTVITGGAGNDTFNVFSSQNTVYITDFTVEADLLDVSYSQSAIKIVQQGPDTVITGGLSSIYLLDFDARTLSASSFLNAGSSASSPHYVDPTVVVNDTVTLAGTPGNDTLTAAATGSSIYGGAGDDVLIGGAGPDHLYGGAGDDRLVMGNGTVYMDGGLGTNTADFSQLGNAVSADLAAGTMQLPGGMKDPLLNFDRVIGSAFNDVITGNGHGDVLSGGGGADYISAGVGNDLLIGDAGQDTLTGGAGADTFLYKSASDSTASAADLITDFTTGADVIDFSAVSPTNLSIIRQGGASFIFASTPGGAMQINVNGAVNGGDIAWGTGHAGVYLVGDNAGDTLLGGSLGDSIHGGSGNDVIIGGAGADGLYGGAGAETFKYTAASDSTASATDLIFDFQTGQDRVDLTSLGINHISTIDNGSAEFLFVETTSGAIMQIAAQGADVIQANDFSVTGGTNFYMQGDAGANTLIGGSGKDVLDGHDGNDVIIGGGGTDALFGGTGSDTFRYLAVSDSTVSAPDTIFDLETGIDKIDLRGVHAAGVGSYGIAYSTTASYLFVDVNGDGVNDMLVQIGNPNLHVGDILWT